VRRHISDLGRTQAMSEFNTIMRSIYRSEMAQKIELRRFANQFMDELKKADRPRYISRWAVEFRLN
ncbi:MAG: hypothetical protein ACC707_14770, partial [Thiohalomonadales bacterium]